MKRLVVVVLVAVTLTGCKKANTDKDTVKKYIDATAPLAHQFTYTDTDTDKTMTVVGVVDDVFRYKARLSVNGQAAWDETVVDDAVADRFDDPAVLPLVAGGVLGQANAEAFAAATAGLAQAPPPVVQNGVIAPVDALRTGRWLLDSTGAPTILASADHHVQGNDPIYDALTTLDYARAAVDASPLVKKFDAQATDPVFPPGQDPFPEPDKSSGVTRYDVKPTPVPSASGSSGGNPPALSLDDFRKMAIYVKNGKVIEIREKIDVLAALPTIVRNYHLKVPANVKTAEQQAAFVKTLYDRQATGAGNDPLRIRDMVLQLLDLGQPQTVTLPTDNIVTGSSSILPFHGITATAAGGSTATTTTATTTTAAPARATTTTATTTTATTTTATTTTAAPARATTSTTSTP